MNTLTSSNNIIGETVVNSLSVVGKTKSIVSMIVATIISLILVIIGIILIVLSYKNKDKLKVTSATIISKTDCRTVIEKNGTKYYCIYGVEYFVNNEKYTSKISSDKSYLVGNIINIYYYKDNVNEITESDNNATMALIGSILMTVAVVILIIAGVTTYFTMKSKSYAAYEGLTAFTK